MPIKIRNPASPVEQGSRTLYAGGRVLNMNYGTSDDINDSASRIASLIDNDGLTHLADYSYLGAGAASAWRAGGVSPPGDWKVQRAMWRQSTGCEVGIA